jgi:predicted DNA-binding protein YlxM (UPF0122 family)
MPMEISKYSLSKFLKPEVQNSWGVPKSCFSNPSWNILIRALNRANLISGKEVIGTILVSQLTELTVSDVSELKHVGKERLENLLKELELITTSTLRPPEASLPYQQENRYNLEQSVVLSILNQANWQDQFLISYGFPFDESIFEDEMVSRKIRILGLRMNGYSLAEIGKQYDVSRERIRQIIHHTYKLVETDPSLEGKSFSEFLEWKTNSAKYEQRRIKQEEAENIDKLVRNYLNSAPGASYSEIASVLFLDISQIQNSIQPQTAKFIFTETNENSVESLFSDDAILEALKLAEAFESPISARRYRELVERGFVVGPGPQTVAIRFGSWKKACELAEVSYNEAVRSNYDTQWHESEMLLYVIEFLINKSFGRGIVSYDEWRIETMSDAPSGAHLRKHFGTWSNTKNKALNFMKENSISCEL